MTANELESGRGLFYGNMHGGIRDKKIAYDSLSPTLVRTRYLPEQEAGGLITTPQY